VHSQAVRPQVPPRGTLPGRSSLRACAAAQTEADVLDACTAPAALDGITTLLLDCDGVLWRGGAAIAGTAQALQQLRARGIRLLFVTNNSSKSREQ